MGRHPLASPKFCDDLLLEILPFTCVCFSLPSPKTSPAELRYPVADELIAEAAAQESPFLVVGNRFLPLLNFGSVRNVLEVLCSYGHWLTANNELTNELATEVCGYEMSSVLSCR